MPQLKCLRCQTSFKKDDGESRDGARSLAEGCVLQLWPSFQAYRGRKDVVQRDRDKEEREREG